MITETIQETVKETAPWLLQGGLRLLAAVLILVIGTKLIAYLRHGVGRSMEKAGLEVTLRKFLDALLHAVSLGILVFWAAEWIGVKTASIVAIVGAVGLAMSLSLQNTLANFAGGCLILFLKPFKVGDYIVASGGEGTVEAIGLVYTTLVSLDNRKIVIPNNSIANAATVNVTGAPKRRLILDVSLSYGADLKHAKAVFNRILEASPYVRKEDGILVVVSELGDSAVVLSGRVWVATADYWTAKWELLEEIKLTFDHEGLDFAYPSMEIYMKAAQEMKM